MISCQFTHSMIFTLTHVSVCWWHVCECEIDAEFKQFIMKKLHRHFNWINSCFKVSFFSELILYKILHNLVPIKSVYGVLFIHFYYLNFVAHENLKFWMPLGKTFFSFPPFTWNLLSLAIEVLIKYVTSYNFLFMASGSEYRKLVIICDM